MAGTKGRTPGEKMLLLTAAGLYLLSMLMMLPQGSGSDAAGRGMAGGFAILLLFPFWAVIGLLLLLLGRRGALPGKSGLAYFALFGAVAFASLLAAGFDSENGGSIPFVAGLLPLVALFYIFWAGAKAQATAQDRWEVARGFGIAFALMITPVYAIWLFGTSQAPQRSAELRAAKARIEKADADFVAARQARFEAYTPERPLEQFVEFLDPVENKHGAALERMRGIPNRQDATIRYLETALRFDTRPSLAFDSLQFQDWGLTPNAALCSAYRKALIRRLVDGPHNSFHPATLDDQIPTMSWLTDNGCDLSGPISDWEKQLAQSNSRTSELDGFAELKAKVRKS